MNFSEDPSTGDYAIDPQRSEAFYRHGLVTEIRITKTQYDALEKKNDERIRWTEKAELKVQKASNLYDLLVRHYSQPERPNPIEKILNTHRKESYADSVEYVVSEIMDDPYQWRLERQQLRGDVVPP